MHQPDRSLQSAILNNIGSPSDATLKNMDSAKKIVAWIGMSPGYQAS